MSSFISPLDRSHLLGELNFLKQQLTKLPVKAHLTRMSTQARIKSVEEKLAALSSLGNPPQLVKLTFSGRPVIDSYGIFADFGAKAINSFSEAITAVAASLGGDLAATGPFPNRSQNQLLITNTAVGSFGFELQENRITPLLLEEKSSVEQAIECAQNLLQGSINLDDELLADAASLLDTRALQKVGEFVKVLADNDARCALVYGQKMFRFTSDVEVMRSLERMSSANIHEAEQTIRGAFQGILPKGRTFEFKVKDPELNIRGKISPAIENAGEINAHLYKEVSIKVMVTQVNQGRPRYLLLAIPEWESPLEQI